MKTKTKTWIGIIIAVVVVGGLVTAGNGGLFKGSLNFPKKLYQAQPDLLVVGIRKEVVIINNSGNKIAKWAFDIKNQGKGCVPTNKQVDFKLIATNSKGGSMIQTDGILGWSLCAPNDTTITAGFPEQEVSSLDFNPTRISITIDPNNTISESNEQNNTRDENGYLLDGQWVTTKVVVPFGPDEIDN